MVAMNIEERRRLGFGTPDHPHVAVHFDLFPAVYFTPTDLHVNTTIDMKGGKVFVDIDSAKAYALKHFDKLVDEEIMRLHKAKTLIAKENLTELAFESLLA
ncbi:MAG: hypothetical protein H9W81_12725 [Enterococcus sp.]|nr:hypothetical protein [Enterococcus sp.]